MDSSNGWETVAADFIRYRGNPATRATAIGVGEVREWARSLGQGKSVIDLGCGPGIPLTEVLVDEGLAVHAIDASPTSVQAFRNNLPDVPIICEAVENSTFFDRSFDGVLAWGLIFLLPPERQVQMIGKVASALTDQGRFLFTSPAERCVWNDALTGRESRSLGAAIYREHLAAAGLAIERQYEDAGQNHYYETRKLGR